MEFFMSAFIFYFLLFLVFIYLFIWFYKVFDIHTMEYINSKKLHDDKGLYSLFHQKNVGLVYPNYFVEIAPIFPSSFSA